MKNSNYEVLHNNSLSALIKDVNNKLSEGYSLAGGIFKDTGFYLQAVYKVNLFSNNVNIYNEKTLPAILVNTGSSETRKSIDEMFPEILSDK